jgi:hypothetical protein
MTLDLQFYTLVRFEVQGVSVWWNANVNSSVPTKGFRAARAAIMAHAFHALRFHIRRRLGQRHGHQSTTLTSLFYKNFYRKVIYVYSYGSNFQDKFIDMIFTFSNSTT